MRLSADIGFSAVASWLPATRQTAAQAVAAGLIDIETADELGYVELPVAAELSAPEMAVLAGRRALDRAGRNPAEVALVLHAWIHYQGHDLWSPAHYVANELGTHRALPIGVQQVCNGGVAAIQLAATWLRAEPNQGYALVATADRFVLPGFDRWRSDYGIAYGDGATAALLHLCDGSADEFVLRAINSEAAPELELMHRGDDNFALASRSHSDRVDIRRTKKAFLTAHGTEPFFKITREKVIGVVEKTLSDAELTPDDPRLRCLAVPRLGRKALESVYLPAMSEATSAPVIPLGAHTGHLGAGDAIASLVAFRERRLLARGEFALVLNAGAGFTWSCLVVEAG